MKPTGLLPRFRRFYAPQKRLSYTSRPSRSRKGDGFVRRPGALTAMPTPLRIGVNALYLIPGGVGGTEIYLRHLLEALAQIDDRNRYFVFTCSEAGGEICPGAPNFEAVVSRIQLAFVLRG